MDENSEMEKNFGETFTKYGRIAFITGIAIIFVFLLIALFICPVQRDLLNTIAGITLPLAAGGVITFIPGSFNYVVNGFKASGGLALTIYLYSTSFLPNLLNHDTERCREKGQIINGLGTVYIDGNPKQDVSVTSTEFKLTQFPTAQDGTFKFTIANENVPDSVYISFHYSPKEKNRIFRDTTIVFKKNDYSNMRIHLATQAAPEIFKLISGSVLDRKNKGVPDVLISAGDASYHTGADGSFQLKIHSDASVIRLEARKENFFFSDDVNLPSVNYQIPYQLP